MSDADSGSATAPASTATGSPRCARCSRAGELDVLTGDYLAELTMLILGRDQLKDPSLGYARTFVRQVEDCLGLALERGVRIVANAGGLNPAGLADKLREVAARARPRPGDRARRGRRPRARAAELGFGGRADRQRLPRRLRHRRARSSAGADVVVTGRVTDASLVVGPAVAHLGWTPDVVRRAGRRRRRRPRHRVRHPGDRRQLLRLPRRCRATRPAARLPDRRDRRRRVERDHQARRHRRRGHRRHGHRAAGVRDPADALPRPRRHRRTSTRSRSPRTATGPGARSPASAARRRRAQLKVCVNELGGFRNPIEFVLTGLDIEAKADWVRAQLDGRLAAAPPASVTWSLGRAPAAGRRDRGGRVAPAARARQGRRPPTRSGKRVHRPRRSSSRWRRTPASR